eukprot:361885-Chlamydomonas_euryale.AAC.17
MSGHRRAIQERKVASGGVPSAEHTRVNQTTPTATWARSCRRRGGPGCGMDDWLTRTAKPACVHSNFRFPLFLSHPNHLTFHIQCHLHNAIPMNIASHVRRLPTPPTPSSCLLSPPNPDFCTSCAIWSSMAAERMFPASYPLLHPLHACFPLSIQTPTPAPPAQFVPQWQQNACRRHPAAATSAARPRQGRGPLVQAEPPPDVRLRHEHSPAIVYMYAMGGGNKDVTTQKRGQGG